MRNRVMPQRQGIFWGRGAREAYFDMIIHISGEIPFLKVDIFHIFERRLHKDANPNLVIEWGPEIENMSNYNTERAWDHALDDWRIENDDSGRVLAGTDDGGGSNGHIVGSSVYS